jgi:hypothetical protein
MTYYPNVQPTGRSAIVGGVKPPLTKRFDGDIAPKCRFDRKMEATIPAYLQPTARVGIMFIFSDIRPRMVPGPAAVCGASV